jgi:hypothetical protein
MKKMVSVRAALLAGATLGFPLSAATAADFGGVWIVEGAIPTGTPVVFSVTGSCVFQQAGADLAGSCKGPRAIGPALGTVNGFAVSWQIDPKPDAPGGASGALRFSGILGADGFIRGQMMYSGLPGRVGEFAAHHP